MDGFLSKALEEVQRAAGHLDVAVIARPADGRWTVAQILEHLTLSFTANHATFEKVLASGELRARRPTPAQRVLRALVIGAGYFPRADAPERTQPRGTVAPDRSVATLREAVTALDVILVRIAERFGEHTPVANHPYLAGLSVRQWRKFHWRHTAHHMRQVRDRTRQVTSIAQRGRSSLA